MIGPVTLRCESCGKRTPFKQLDDAMAAGWYVEVVCPRWGMAFCPDCQDRHDDDRLRQDIDATVSALLDSCEDAFEGSTQCDDYTEAQR